MSSNLPSAQDHPEIITEHITIEVAKGRMLGPLPDVHIALTGKEVKIWEMEATHHGFFSHMIKMSMNGIDADMASLFYVKVEVVIKAAQIGQGSLLANIK